METPERLQKMDEPNNNHNDENENVEPSATASTSSKGMESPKTPTRPTFDDSFDDYDTDEMESPKFPHLIPIYRRRDDVDYDLKDVRIGWDDGCGCVFYKDDDYDTYRNGKRLRRSKRGRLFTDHRHRNGRNKYDSNSPSPISNQTENNAAIQAELNDYLGRILSCLSAKKRNRQLLKAKNEASASANNSIENNNIKSLLDDSADDELILLCTQAAEKTIANDDTNCKTVKNGKKSEGLSIVGITPLKDTNDNANNNVYQHVSKKFKPICDLFDVKKSENLQSQCHTFTSNMDKNLQNNTEKNKKDDLVSLFNDSLTNDDYLFSSIDLSEIEQQISSDNKTISASVTQKCNKQQNNTHISKQYEKKPACSTSTITSDSSSVLWRRSTSTSSIASKQSQSQDKKSVCIVPKTQINPSGSSKTTVTRYCTPAEIEEKRNRARRTLLLKFKSKNKSIS